MTAKRTSRRQFLKAAAAGAALLPLKNHDLRSA